MKITSAGLAWLCVALLVLYPVSAILVWAYTGPDDNHGILAALLAANAGTAFFVRLAFGLPEFSDYTSGALRFSLLAIGIGCGLVSALSWMMDEVEHLGLEDVFEALLVAPVLVILLVLVWFIDKVKEEKTSNRGQ